MNLIKTLEALIDGDVLKYACGFSAEKNYYDLKLEDTVVSLPRMAHVHEYCGEAGISPEDADITMRINPGPPQLSYDRVKSKIKGILKAVKTDNHTIFISGEGNYRDTIDSIAPYKGNREGARKPKWFEAIHEYIVKNYNTVVVDGIEADDALGIAQTAHPDRTIICTIDKDLNMIAGQHYNWMNNTRYYVSPEDADTWFWSQLIIGDSATDNIKGVPGKGKMAAARVLTECDTNQERFDAILKMYGNYYDLLENANLLWIQREEGVFWTPQLMNVDL